MAVLDALVDKETRSSPFLANLPSMRIDVDAFKTDAVDAAYVSELARRTIRAFR